MALGKIMNTVFTFFKTLLFVPLVALLSALMLIEVGWTTLKTGILSCGQQLARSAGRNGDAVELARKHLLSIREAMAAHSARLSALISWCFKKPDAKTA